MQKLSPILKMMLPAFFLTVILISSCKEESNDPVYENSVAGLIKDAEGYPVPYAEIEAYKENGNTKKKTTIVSAIYSKDTTDENGLFLLKGLPDDLENIKVRVNHPDYKTFEGPITSIMGNGNNNENEVGIEPRDECQARINIYTVDEDDNPVDGVDLRLNRQARTVRKSRSDANGSFSFDNVCPGEYWIRAEKEGYKLKEEEFVVLESDTSARDIHILMEDSNVNNVDSCCYGIFTIDIVDSVSGEPIPNAKVIVHNNGEEDDEEMETNENGECIFVDMCEGEYELEVIAEGFEPFIYQFTMKCNDTINYKGSTTTTVIEDSCCDGSITIYPVDEQGLPLEGIEVTIIYNNEKESKLTVDGKVVFEPLCEGEYYFQVIGEGFEITDFKVVLDCNAKKEVERIIRKNEVPPDTCCDGILYFIPVDNNGAVIENAKIELWMDTTLVEEGEVHEGRIVMDNLCEGEYTILIHAEGYEPKEVTFVLKCNEQKEIREELTRTEQEDSCCDGRIYIIPRDSETNGIIKGAKVTLLQGEKTVGEAVLEGNYIVFEDLCEGDYTIVIMHGDYEKVEIEIHLGCNEEIERTEKLKLVIPEDTCCDGKIIIVAKDMESKKIIQGAKIRLWKNGEKIGEIISGQSAVKFSDLCEGDYIIDIIHEDYEDIDFKITLDCNETEEVKRELESTVEPEDSCCDGRIYVMPRDKESGKVLKNAKVKLVQNGQILAHKNVEGEYVEFKDLCDGDYTILIVLDGYETIEYEFKLGCNEYKEINKYLEKEEEDCCHGIAYFIIKDENTHARIREAKVKLYYGDDFKEELYTNSDGIVIFDGLCKGTHTIKLSHGDYEEVQYTFEMKCNDSLQAYKYMKKKGNGDCCDGVAHFIIKDEDSHSRIGEAKVKLYFGGDLLETKYTNSDGIVYFTDLCEGNYIIDLSRCGYQNKEYSFEMGCNDTLHAYKYMKQEGQNDTCHTASFKFLVKDSITYEHLDSAFVEVICQELGFYWSGYTNHDGYIEIEGLTAPACYVIEISIDGYEDKRLTHTFTKCYRQTATIKMKEED